MQFLKLVPVVLLVLATALPAAAAPSKPQTKSANPHNCVSTSYGFTPLMDLGAGMYHGYQGGFYPNGSNTPPAGYLAAGVAAGQSVQPVGGKIALLGIGMSTAGDFFRAFVSQARADSRTNPAVVFVDGTYGGADLQYWSDPSSNTWVSVDSKLSRAGVTRDQVGAVWMLNARADSGWGRTADFPVGAREIAGQMEQVTDIVDARFPNAKQMHLNSQDYKGYALNPPAEPKLGYENEFSVKWAIEDRITGASSGRAWLGWSASLWADGKVARSDGLTWPCTDYADAVHVNSTGAAKGAKLILNAYLNDPTTPWFRR